MQPYKGSELTEMLKIIKYILQCIIIDHRSSYTAVVVRKRTQESAGQGICGTSVIAYSTFSHMYKHDDLLADVICFKEATPDICTACNSCG